MSEEDRKRTDTVDMNLCKLVFSSVVTLIVLTSAGVDSASPKKKYPEDKNYMYRVQLRDKHATPYSISEPLAYLSQKAIERRQRQNIAIDSTDLPVSQVYEKSLQQQGVSVVCKSKWNNTVVVRLNDTTVVDKIKQLPFVAGMKKVWVSPDSISEDKSRPKYHKELVLHDNKDADYYGAAAEQIKMLGGDKLHAEGYRGKGMMIAVLDAGFTNADLIPAFREVDVMGFLDFVQSVKSDMFTASRHGTQVLSTMAVNVPNVYVGTAPEASYWLLRCEDQQTEQPVEEDYWTAAAEYADSVGVDVINSSMGFHDYDNPADSYSYWQQDGKTTLISRTASMLCGKGIVLVNSAGNEGNGAWKKIIFPADATDILSVGAVTSIRRYASFSSLGPTQDGRIKPDVMAQGSPTKIVTTRGTISSDSGTSFASPLIAGLVACLWQKFPQKTAKEIMEMVRQSADNIIHPDNVYGYGIPDFSNIK